MTVEHRTPRVIGHEVAMDRATLLRRWTLEVDAPAVVARATAREAAES